MAGEQNERLSAGTTSGQGNGSNAWDVDAGRAFGFYLVMGILVALVTVGLVFVFQH